MKVVRLLMALLLVGLLTGVAHVSQRTETAGSRMANAAEKFLRTLTAEQSARAIIAFEDPERLNWHFIPLQDKGRKYTRKGMPLEEMTSEQKDAALALVAAGTSADGSKKVTTIMSLESILHDLEKNGAMVRNPGWYFFTVFGKPSAVGKWGWRVEGHHLSLNFTMEGGKVVSATPAFFGANPALIKDGPRKGLRPLPEAEDLAKDLFQELDNEKRTLARQEKLFPEIEARTAAPRMGEPAGLAAEKMNDRQRNLLKALLRSYARRMPEDVAEAELAQIERAGFDKIFFAYAGGLDQGKPHTYRVQGPTFVVEFLNVQPDSANNPANHIHSAWRSMAGDFGLARK